MSYEDFSPDYKQLILDIAENFGQNISRQVQEDVERKRRGKRSDIPFANVGIKQNGITIKLQNMKLVTTPLFDVINMNVDFKNMVINAKFHLKDLRIENEYEINTPIFGSHITQHGKMKFTVKNVHATGKIGMFIKQDSFIPSTYDIDYSFDEILTEVYENIPCGQPCDHNCFNVKQNTDIITESNLDSSLSSLFWMELEETLTGILNRHMCTVVVEYSVGELLLDEPDNLKKYERFRTLTANAFVDEWLKEYKGEYTKNAENARVEPMSILIKHGGIISTFETSSGRLLNLDTLTRISEITQYVDEHKQKVYFGYATLNDFNFEFEGCTISYKNINIKSTASSRLNDNKLFVKVVVPPSGKRQIAIKFVSIGRVTQKLNLKENDASAFCWLKEKLEAFITGYVRQNSIVVLKKFAHKFNLMTKYPF